MTLLGYWPPAAHLALVATCAATAWWRLETAPVAPSGASVPGDLIASAPAQAAGSTSPGARDRDIDVEAVSARALFRPGRLAATGTAVVPAQADPVSQMSSPALRMVGYVEQAGRPSAILETVEDGRSHIVHEGDEIAGGLVRQITPSAVVIETAGQTVTVELYPD